MKYTVRMVEDLPPIRSISASEFENILKQRAANSMQLHMLRIMQKARGVAAGKDSMPIGGSEIPVQ